MTREDAAVHRRQVRREDHLHGLAGGPAENLLDLRLMAVLADAVGRDALVALGKVRVQLGRAARAGNAALAIDDDVVRLDPAGLQQRRERQDGRGGIAAGIGDELGLRNLRRRTARAGRRAFCRAARGRDARARTTGDRSRRRSGGNRPRSRSRGRRGPAGPWPIRPKRRAAGTERHTRTARRPRRGRDPPGADRAGR